MWATVAVYLIPAGVTLYGLIVLATGEVSGFGTRVVRGPLARLLGVMLAAALPLAIWLGPAVKIELFPRKPDFQGKSREVEIVREILAEHRALDDWRQANEPDRQGARKTVPQIDDRLAELKKFEAAYKERVAQTQVRVEELQAEQDGLMAEREARAAKDRRTGPTLVGGGVLLSVWALARVMGRKRTPGE